VKRTIAAFFSLVIIGAMAFNHYGCAAKSGYAKRKPHNLSRAEHVSNPATEIFRDPEVDFSKYKTFSVFPASLLSKSKEVQNEIRDKQLLFSLRNYFESRGYKFVELGKSPDMLVTMLAASEYKEKYIPPQQVIVPMFTPGYSIYSSTDHSGQFNYGPIGSLPNYGSYRGQSSTSTYVPGQTSYHSMTLGGYYQGYNYPSISIAALDNKTGKVIWKGSAGWAFF